MPYITSIERLGRQEGRQEGRQQTLREDILDVLEARFGEVPDALREQIQVIVGDAELKQLHRQAVLALSLEAFQNSVSELRAG